MSTNRIEYHDAAGNRAWGSILDQPMLSEGADYPDASSLEDDTRLNRLLTWVSKKLKICKYGPEGNWAARFTDAIFVDCLCCTALRALFIGLIVGGALSATMTALVMRLF